MPVKSKVKTKTTTKVKSIIKEQIEGECEVVPNPNFTAKQFYRLEGLGRLFNGVYYCKRCVHTLSSDGYKVTLSLVRLGETRTTISEVVQVNASSSRKAPSKKTATKTIKKTNTASSKYKVVGISLKTGSIRMGRPIE